MRGKRGFKTWVCRPDAAKQSHHGCFHPSTSLGQPESKPLVISPFGSPPPAGFRELGYLVHTVRDRIVKRHNRKVCFLLLACRTMSLCEMPSWARTDSLEARFWADEHQPPFLGSSMCCRSRTRPATSRRTPAESLVDNAGALTPAEMGGFPSPVPAKRSGRS